MTTNRRYATVSVRLLTLAAIAAASLGSGCASLSLSGTHHQADDSASGYASIMRAAESVRRSGDLATATMLYQRAHHLESHDAPPLIALGEIAASAGAPGQAATAFREALRRSPDDVNARRLYGNALLAVDAPAQAAEQFRHVLEVEPEDTRAERSRGFTRSSGKARGGPADLLERSGATAGPPAAAQQPRALDRADRRF